jgi:hypothetical protein
VQSMLPFRSYTVVYSAELLRQTQEMEHVCPCLWSTLDVRTIEHRWPFIKRSRGGTERPKSFGRCCCSVFALIFRLFGISQILHLK